MNGESLVSNIIEFARVLRGGDLSVDPGQTVTSLRAVELTGFSSRGVVKAAGGTVFVRRREERIVFDLAFDLFWRRRGEPGVALRLPRMRQANRRSLGADPATAGLRAALPHVNEFVPCASVASLEELAGRLSGFGRSTGGRDPAA